MIDPVSFYHLLKPVSLDKFGEAFTTVKNSAFRLELLDLYTVPDETEAFKRYLLGETKPPPDFNEEWREILRSAATKGINFQRVRLVKDLPNDYLKFEVAWGYSLNSIAGEDIRVIFYNHMPIFKTEIPILKDFWLFDDITCYLIEYDAIGQFLGVSETPNNYVGLYVNLKKEALLKSVPIKETKIWRYASEY